MSHSEQINELSAALSKAQGAMKAAAFNKVNPHFNSKYADLAAVWEAIRDPLSKNGLAVTQTMETHGNGSFVLHTILHHSSGQWLSSDYPLPSGAKPQELGSALTYARRYSLSAIVGIAADEDDDGNEAQKSPKKADEPAMPPMSARERQDLVAKPVDAGEPREIQLGDDPDWRWFGQQMIALASSKDWPKWEECNQINLRRMSNEKMKLYALMLAAIAKARA